MIPRRLAAIWLLAACTAAAGAQPVQGDVAIVGFQAPNNFVVRLGQWIPIQVRLSVQGSQLFTGSLRIEGVDLDGDRVAYVEQYVTVTPEAGTKRIWCYLVANSFAPSEWPTSVDVLSEDGVLMGKLPLPPCDLVRNDDLLVLDLSRATAEGRGVLKRPGYYRNVVVTTLPNGANDLPDRWWGLEAVDVILWDQPNPDAVSPAQLDAVVEWVRSGGQLVVGVGASWNAIRKNATLAAIMPLESDAPVVELRKLGGFARQLGLASFRQSGELEAPIAATSAKPASDAVVTLMETDSAQQELPLITMRLVGSGRVVATAASLHDLGATPVDQTKFYAALLDLNMHTTDYEKQRESIGWAMGAVQAEKSLHEALSNVVGFRGTSALYGIIAFFFVAAYVVAATLASWWWLRRRKLTHLSWSVFAGFAVAGSALSLVTASAMHGLSKVAALSMLDLDAGARTARGHCLFGYRSALRQVTRLSLPGEGQFLRSLARRQQDASKYVTPARYASIPARARLDDVLMRATLKQFEGYWQGELDGTITANLVVQRGPSRQAAGRLTAASSIANDLGVDIAGGYLLFIDPRQRGSAQPSSWVPARAPGLTTLYDRPSEPAEVPPSMNVLAVRLPAILAGGQIRGLGGAMYDDIDERYSRWVQRKGERKDMPDLTTLCEAQQDWVTTSVLGRDEAVRAALLASTRNLYLACGRNDFDKPEGPITTEGLPNLDITHWLLGGESTGVAVLLCWSDDPGPARLHREGKPMRSSEGLTLYRVRVPIRYQGNPPSPGS